LLVFMVLFLGTVHLAFEILDIHPCWKLPFLFTAPGFVTWYYGDGSGWLLFGVGTYVGVFLGKAWFLPEATPLGRARRKLNEMVRPDE